MKMTSLNIFLGCVKKSCLYLFHVTSYGGRYQDGRMTCQEASGDTHQPIRAQYSSHVICQEMSGTSKSVGTMAILVPAFMGRQKSAQFILNHAVFSVT